MKNITISSVKDLEDLLEVVLKGEQFKIDEIKPIPYELHFYGEKFKIKDGYISAEFADFLATFRKEYKNFLVASLGKSKVSEVEVFFKVEDGCVELDLLNAIPKEVWGLFEKMDGTQLSYIFIISIIGFFSTKAWKDYLENQKHKIETTEANETNKKSLEVATKAIEALGKKPKLEKAKNKPMKEALEMLAPGDTLKIHTEKAAAPAVEYNSNDVSKFDYIEEFEETTSTLTDTFEVKAFEVIQDGWRIKLRSTLLNTFHAISQLDPKDNTKLFQAADDKEKINLSVRLIRQGKEIKEAYIQSIS